MAEVHEVLKIARGLELPLELVGESVAVVAKRNAGKTYTASVIAEELIDAGQQVVVLDPVGVHYGLATNAKGDGPGLPVIVLGGEHGVLPLAPDAGAVIADLVVDSWPQSYVLDLSTFDSNAQQDRFATDFAERLFRRKAKVKRPMMLMLEEADAFAPQAPMPDQRRMLGAFTVIARRGRSRGLGYIAVTQRPAALHKDLTTQAEVLVILQLIGVQDRKAVDEWVKSNATEEERATVMGSLASLQQGEAWIWSPGWLKLCKRVKIRKRRTFDASRSPAPGEARVEVTAQAEVDLELVRERIETALADQRANDPKELRKRITELEREAEQMQRDGMQAGGALEDVLAAFGWDGEPKGRRALVEWAKARAAERTEVPVPTLPEGHLEELERTRNHVQLAATGPLTDATANLQRANRRLEDLITQARKAGSSNQVAKSEARPMSPTPRLQRPAARVAPASSNGSADGDLGKAHRAILTVLAQRGQRTKDQIALETGYSSGGGGFNNALGRLRSLGYVTTGSPITATVEGLQALGEYDPLPTGRQLMEHWMNHSQVPKAGRLVLEALDRHGPMDKQSLAEMCGYEASGGGFNNALGRLRSLGLVTKGSGPIALTPDFEDAIR